MPRIEVRITKKSGNYTVRAECFGSTMHWKRMVFGRGITLKKLRPTVVALLDSLPFDSPDAVLEE